MSSGSSKTGYDVTGGGTNAPWNWGVSPFDQSMINQATTSDETATTNRYQQLGLGGSTMEAQDIGTSPTQTGGIIGQGEAMTGQEQTENVGQPALNPALQPQLNSLIGAGQGGSSLSQLASGAGLASSIGGLL